MISLSPYFFCFPTVKNHSIGKLPEKFPVDELRVISCKSLTEAQFFENGMEENLDQISRNMEHFDSSRSFKEIIERDSTAISDQIIQKTFFTYLKNLNKNERAVFAGSLNEMTELDPEKLFIGDNLDPSEEEFARVDIPPKLLSSIFNFIRVTWYDQENEFALLSHL